ncbi:hypothetical protein GCM10009727_28390 [Actinomadura napierensis]|uniref:Molecular chaperone DnaJ n=1 Tax=Actinomadura napierensis TaxID=267854 RepID=A0ABP5KM75_9ACTN
MFRLLCTVALAFGLGLSVNAYTGLIGAGAFLALSFIPWGGRHKTDFSPLRNSSGKIVEPQMTNDKCRFCRGKGSNKQMRNSVEWEYVTCAPCKGTGRVFR